MSINYTTSKSNTLRLNAYAAQVSGLGRFYSIRRVNSFLLLISELAKNSDRNFSTDAIAKNFI